VNPAWVEVGIGAATFVLSISASAFISGTRWGRVETDMRSMNDRLAKIEGMFTLVYKDPHSGG
jgi:hypothetical protein